MPTFVASQRGYENLWGRCALTNEASAPANSVGRKIIALRNRYEPVARAIGAPQVWPLIGAIHDREASLNFAGVLHNGERIIGTGRKTSLVPRGRGPFTTWEDAAEDALRLQNWQNIRDWPLARWLYEAEAFNGWGYVAHGVNSPYVWGGTNLQQRGKYVADGRWNASAWDSQLGVAAILKAIFAIDASLEPGVPQTIDVEEILSEIKVVLEKHLGAAK